MIAIPIAVVAIYLAVCFVLAKNYLSPIRTVPSLPPGLQEVSVETRFGETPCWATPNLASGKPSKVVFVLAHGYGGTRASWDFAMHDLFARGFDSLALSMPGQDASPVPQVSFGVNEAHVIVEAEQWVKHRNPGTRVVVLGMSMGGGAAWLASQEDPSIDGIITDSSFARFDESMNAFFDRKLRFGRYILAPVVWIARSISGIDPSSVNPVDAAALWKGKPALVIQGDADTLVVPSHATRLATAADCPSWLVRGAEHVQCFEMEPKKYTDHLVDFARRIEIDQAVNLQSRP